MCICMYAWIIITIVYSSSLSFKFGRKTRTRILKPFGVVLCIYLFDYIHLCTCVASMCCVCMYIYIYIYACMYYVCMYYVCPFICMYIFIYALICMSNKIITIFIFILCLSSSASFIIFHNVCVYVCMHESSSPCVFIISII